MASPTGRADSGPPQSEEQGMSGCIWGAAAKRGLGGRLREGANVYNLYIHSYISRDHDGVSPPFRGTPRCGIQVRTIFLATDTRRVHKTRGGSGHASAGTTTNSYIIIIFVYHLYAYIGFIHIYIYKPTPNIYPHY